MSRSSHHFNQSIDFLRDHSLCEISCLFEKHFEFPSLPLGRFRDRVFTPFRTFWLFLYQVLLGPHQGSCREALRKAQGWLFLQEGESISSSTSAYCQARKRLPVWCFETLFNQSTKLVEAQVQEAWLWRGRSVKVVDGSSLSMPDTEANQKVYPQPESQAEGCGFPTMRLVGLFSLATGALLELNQGALSSHERNLWRQLWSSLKFGDVILADRGFCGYADYWCLLQQGIDSVMRLHPRRKATQILRTLSKNDLLVEWTKTPILPRWMDRIHWEKMPETLRVRHLTFSFEEKGFRTKKVTVATTLLDAQLYPIEAITQLYRQRWRVELYLRDIKIALGMDILRCKSPEMIQKELFLFMTLYNLIRWLMIQAATEENLLPENLSFTGTVATLRQWMPFFALANQEQRAILRIQMLLCIQKDPLPYRPDRLEPRARKRRPKNYQLLKKHRKFFKEITHRNHYIKTLS